MLRDQRSHLLLPLLLEASILRVEQEDRVVAEELLRAAGQVIDDGVAVANGVHVGRLQPAAQVHRRVSLQQSGHKPILPARRAGHQQHAQLVLVHIDGRLPAVVVGNGLEVVRRHGHPVGHPARLLGGTAKLYGLGSSVLRNREVFGLYSLGSRR